MAGPVQSGEVAPESTPGTVGCGSEFTTLTANHRHRSATNRDPTANLAGPIGDGFVGETEYRRVSRNATSASDTVVTKEQ